MRRDEGILGEASCDPSEARSLARTLIRRDETCR